MRDLETASRKAVIDADETPCASGVLRGNMTCENNEGETSSRR